MKPGESVAGRLYRDAAEDVGEAIRVLNDGARPREERVHEVRKTLKQVRTRFRLLKGCAPLELDEAVHSLARLASRVLATLRDQDIMPEVIGDLLKQGNREQLYEEIRECLFKDGRPAQENGKPEDHFMDRGRDILSCLETVMAEPIRPEEDLATVETNLRRIYRRGRKLATTKRLSPEQLHSLRKRVKDLHHISDFFDARKLRSSTKKLGDILGDHQDLMVLEEFLNTAAMEGDPPLQQEIRSLALSRRKVLASRAKAAARRLFKKGSCEFVTRLKIGRKQV